MKQEQLEALTETNPRRYREMCIPHENPDAAHAAVVAFLKDVRAARLAHRIADVTVLASARAIVGEEETEWLTQLHLGDQLKAPFLLAQAYGTAQERITQSLAETSARSRRRERER